MKTLLEALAVAVRRAPWPVIAVALAGSAMTAMAGLGILVVSTTIPFRRFGFVTAYTIGLALVAAVLILPSYLVLWDRWHRRRGEDPVDREALEASLRTEIRAGT